MDNTLDLDTTKISLTEEGKFNIDFAYIPESDDWVNLYMKGISDLKREELGEHNIPLEEWEKRVELKKKNKLTRIMDKPSFTSL